MRYVFVVQDYGVLTEVHRARKISFILRRSLSGRILRIVIIISVEIIRR